MSYDNPVVSLHVKIHRKQKEKVMARYKSYGMTWEELLCEMLGIKTEVLLLAKKGYGHKVEQPIKAKNMR